MISSTFRRNSYRRGRLKNSCRGGGIPTNDFIFEYEFELYSPKINLSVIIL